MSLDLDVIARELAEAWRDGKRDIVVWRISSCSNSLKAATLVALTLGYLDITCRSDFAEALRSELES